MAEFKFDITEEQIEAALKDVIAERLENAVLARHGSWMCAVEHYVSEEIGKMVKSEANARFDEIASEIVDDFMSKPVQLNDGWGRSEKKYDTYADFIGDKLRDKFNRDYDLRRAFKDQLEKRVDKVWEEYQKDAIAILLAKANALSKAER